MARGRLHAGTSGYSYKEWKGAFYPEGLPERRFLEYYAEKLPSVEVNSTFYRVPAETLLESWRDGTPGGFIFAIKANQGITHRGRLQNVGDLTRDFVNRCSVLGPKLGPILFQLPPNLRCEDEKLARFLEGLPAGPRYAMEFRHETWLRDSVFDRLTAAGIALCVSEGEALDTPRMATAPFSYLRLRKEEYTDAELAAWREWIHAELERGRDVFAYLKHDEKGASPERALQLLRPAPAPVPGLPRHGLRDKGKQSSPRRHGEARRGGRQKKKSRTREAGEGREGKPTGTARRPAGSTRRSAGRSRSRSSRTGTCRTSNRPSGSCTSCSRRCTRSREGGPR